MPILSLAASATALHFLEVSFQDAVSYVSLVVVLLQIFKRMIKIAEFCHPVLGGKARQVHDNPGKDDYSRMNLNNINSTASSEAQFSEEERGRGVPQHTRTFCLFLFLVSSELQRHQS